MEDTSSCSLSAICVEVEDVLTNEFRCPQDRLSPLEYTFTFFEQKVFYPSGADAQDVAVQPQARHVGAEGVRPAEALAPCNEALFGGWPVPTVGVQHLVRKGRPASQSAPGIPRIHVLYGPFDPVFGVHELQVASQCSNPRLGPRAHGASFGIAAALALIALLTMPKPSGLATSSWRCTVTNPASVSQPMADWQQLD